MGTEAKRDHPVSYAGWGLGGPGLKPESLWSTNLRSGNTPARCSEVPCDGFTAPQTVAYKVCYQGWDVNPAGLAPESRLVTSQGAARSPPPPPRPFVGPLFGPGAGLPLDMHRLSLQTVMPNRKSLCPCFTDKETESERSLPQMVGVEPGFVQAGWSPVCVLTTGHLSLPQVKLAHPCPFFQT